MASSKDPLPLGALVGGTYRLVSVLGAGAMGTVFEAERADGSRVALKALLRLGASREGDERRVRFEREAAVCARLTHPNIVPVIDHGIDAESDAPYLVMPRLVGEDMSALLARVSALEPEIAVAMIVQACHGLEAAHAAGVVHRDIKPSNLFLEEDGDHVRVRVMDFGLAKVHGAMDGLTPSGAFMGSAHYVSPEQATSAKHVDGRSDVWSLAMALYHALAGAPAFARTGSFLAFIVELRSKGAPPLQDIAPWVSPRIARAVHAALLKEPALRFPSIVELRLALDMAVGFDASRKAVRRDSLSQVSEATRAKREARAVLPEWWEDLQRG
jgi:serine/threonine-protein kinase